MDKQWVLKTVTTVMAMALAGCGGSNSSSTGTSANGSLNSSGEVVSSLTRGFTLPSEISAVPADATSTVSASLRSSRSPFSQLRVLVGVTDSDYNKATTAQYIEERTLEQFDIIETVIKSLAQTNYSDSANINQGPYKAMVAWEEKGSGGRDVKKLQPWVVDSRLIKGTGPYGNVVDINRVLVWIVEDDPNHAGQKRLIKAEFKIYTEASFNAAGEVTDYGEWDINVKFNDAATEYFAATSRIQGGINLLKMRMAGNHSLKAILYRAGSAGFGQVEYPDCSGGPCGSSPTLEVARYAYNKDYLAVKDKAVSNPGGAITYKDRASKVKMVRRYGLFYKNAGSGIAAGDSVERHKQFGFPVTYTDSNGTQFGYYGAWQGRHQLWGGQSGTITPGTIVTRQDFGANATPATYTVSPSFNGTLSRRAYVSGVLADIQNIPFEIWINKHVEIKWNNGATQWQSCAGWWDYSGAPQCRDFNNNPLALTDFTAELPSLVVAAADRKWVSIMHNDAGTMRNYVYLTANPSNGITWTGTGFYPAVTNPNGGWQAATSGSIYSPADGDQLMVDIGGSIYIEYDTVADADGTGWQQKKLQSFDQQTWTPVFASGQDTAYGLDLGREYYFNANGVNYVVKKVDTSGTPATDYSVRLELQTTANPNNVKSTDPKYIFHANIHHFASPWEPTVHFTFDSNPSSSNFMKLVYLTDDPGTAASDIGNVMTEMRWGLWAYNSNGDPIDASGAVVTVTAAGGIPSSPPMEFNWEYSTNGGWGAQQYLIDSNNNYVLLSDSILLTVGGGVALKSDWTTTVATSLTLQYDGWMHGLPDLYKELEVNGWVMNSAISDKIINIPADTLVTDNNGVQYYVKPLEVGVFLNAVGAGAGRPDISLAEVANLNSVPTFTDHKMGVMPTDVVTKYSEGNPVQ